MAQPKNEDVERVARAIAVAHGFKNTDAMVNEDAGGMFVASFGGVPAWHKFTSAAVSAIVGYEECKKLYG